MDKWQEAYMDVAERFAQLSTARRLKVGAIAVKENRIISIGYNGTPSGWDNDCEFWRPNEGVHWEVPIEDREIYGTYYTKPEVIHAERNALDKLARSSESASGASLYITHAPCLECAKSIYTSGIVDVFYRNEYRNEEGVDFLESCSIGVHKI